MLKRDDKKAQMKMSFGMIFSIILIVAFLAFTFYAIQKFLGFKKVADVGIFKDNLQRDINDVWKSSQSSQNVEYILPSEVNYVCFINSVDDNLVFKSESYIPGGRLNHLDMERILDNVSGDEFCIRAEKEKVKFILKKDFGDALVVITTS